MATIDKLRRKYNAAYRLRKKLGVNSFPPRSRIIYSDIAKDISNIAEVKILIQESGFIVQPLFFSEL